jgi:uncharacterized protein (TIGR00645 family)
MADYSSDNKSSDEDIVYKLNKIETFVEQVIYASRWLLVPVFLGLVVALAGYSVVFCYQAIKFIFVLFTYEKNDLLLAVLTFVDKVLVSGLIVMVLIGGYENSVGKLNVPAHKNRLSWLGKVGSSSLKIKLSTSIVSISSIHLLKMFLDVNKYSFAELAWTTGIHVVMVVTSILLAYMDKILGTK